MTVTDSPVDNGVNVGALLEAREALSGAPEAAQFQWRATCEWVNGTHSHSTVEGFFGLGEEQSHRTQYSFDVDHPEIFDHRSIVGAGGGERRRSPRSPTHPAGDGPHLLRRWPQSLPAEPPARLPAGFPVRPE